MSYFRLKERLFQVFRPRTGSPALDGGARESLDSKVPPGPNAIALTGDWHFLKCQSPVFHSLDSSALSCYTGNNVTRQQEGAIMPRDHKKIRVERTQLGVRMEKRLVKVLKAIAELYDMTLGDLLEGIVLHAFEGKSPFSSEDVQRINQLKEIYGVDYDSSASHKFVED
jgi:hypothetical protein